MVFISVIITAYDRKEFLMQAVNSALNQTLPRDEYEVIVVKNFEDYDKELEKLGVKTIVIKDKELGKKIVIGTEEAKGEIITLLEDDDLFLPTKLEKVRKMFKNNDIILYANGTVFFRDNDVPKSVNEVKNTERLFNIKEIKKGEFRDLVSYYRLPPGNSKSSVRREIIERYSNILERFTYAFDVLLFSLSALSEKNFILDNEVLTLTRIHSRNSGSLAETDFNKWLERQILIRKRYAEGFKGVKEVIENNFNVSEPHVRIIYDYVNYQLSLTKIALKVFSKDEKISFSDLLNVVKFNPKISYIILYLAALSPSSVKNMVIRKWFEKNNRRAQSQKSDQSFSN